MNLNNSFKHIYMWILAHSHTLSCFAVLIFQFWFSVLLLFQLLPYFVIKIRFKDQTLWATHRWAALCSAALVWALVLIALSLSCCVCTEAGTACSSPTQALSAKALRTKYLWVGDQIYTRAYSGIDKNCICIKMLS